MEPSEKSVLRPTSHRIARFARKRMCFSDVHRNVHLDFWRNLARARGCREGNQSTARHSEGALNARAATDEASVSRTVSI